MDEMDLANAITIAVRTMPRGPGKRINPATASAADLENVLRHLQRQHGVSLGVPAARASGGGGAPSLLPVVSRAVLRCGFGGSTHRVGAPVDVATNSRTMHAFFARSSNQPTEAAREAPAPAVESSLSESAGATGLLEPGVAVLVEGLKARPDLNGTPAVVVAFAAERERYRVKMTATGEELYLRPENVRAASRGKTAGAAAADAADNAPVDVVDLSSPRRSTPGGVARERGADAYDSDVEEPNAPPIDLLSSDSEGEDAPAETPDGPDEARADAAPPSSTRALEPSAAHAARVTAFLRGVDAETRAGLLEEIQRAAADLIRLRGELRRLEGAIREGRRRKSRAGGRAPADDAGGGRGFDIGTGAGFGWEGQGASSLGFNVEDFGSW